MMIYFTDDRYCPAHPEQMNKCTQKHGPVPGGWADIRWWNGEMRFIGSEEVEETEPPIAVDE